MTMWILILFAHVGPMGTGNSNALAMHEFTSQQNCIAAGEAARKLASTTVKEIGYACTPR